MGCVNYKTTTACGNFTKALAAISGHDITHIINWEGDFHFDM